VADKIEPSLKNKFSYCILLSRHSFLKIVYFHCNNYSLNIIEIFPLNFASLHAVHHHKLFSCKFDLRGWMTWFASISSSRLCMTSCDIDVKE
jgi:hypothetical protein